HGPNDAVPKANLSSAARAYLKTIGVEDPDQDRATAALIWMHALAISYSPDYLSENGDGIRCDWPRIPLPSNKDSLIHSAELGTRISAVLDIDQAVQGVT